jgi:hypothetical protein
MADSGVSPIVDTQHEYLVDGDDLSDASPEPSPVGPPSPHAFLHTSAAAEDDLTVNMTLSTATPQANNKGQAVGMGSPYSYFSTSSLPSPPYSLLPENLGIREERSAITSAMKTPKQTKRTEVNASFESDVYSATIPDLTMATPRSSVMTTSPESTFSDTSNNNTLLLLPAVQHLKRDLQESHQSIYLLKQENKSLASECETLQQQLLECQSLSEQKSHELESLHVAMKSQMARLEQTLAKSTQKNRVLIAEKTALRKELVERERTRVEVSIQTDPPAERTDAASQTDVSDDATLILPSGSFSISSNPAGGERIARIRDAAERAAFLQDHRREIGKLKAEHKVELFQLQQRHEDGLKRVVQEAKSEVRIKTEKYKETMQNEYERKIKSLEEKYKAEMHEVSFLC